MLNRSMLQQLTEQPSFKLPFKITAVKQDTLLREPTSD